jgi:transketolase
METVQQAYGRALIDWARNRPNVVVLSGDLTGSTEISAFKRTYPDRFFSLGMAEQNMMSFAGGLAREGFLPFVHTFAVFMYRRALDQVEMSIAYPNQRVRMVGFLPGITTPGGATHQAINDVGVLRTLPNMNIFEVGDATDIESCFAIAEAIEGPLYLRMLRKEVPRLFPKKQPTLFNQARTIRDGKDILLLSTGICTEEVMRAAALLERHGIGVGHLHITTLKPFSDQTVAEAIAETRSHVITVENHTVVGGLGTAVAEMMSEHGLSKTLVRLGIEDTYSHGASQSYLMRRHAIDALAVVERVSAVLKLDLECSAESLAQERLGEFLAEEQLEAL